MARKIVITSGKGGVGKTTVSAYLASCLARKGQRVLLCDADFGLNNIDVVTGVENMVTYDLVDVIEGRCRARQALIAHPDFATLYVLTSSHSAPERYVSPQAFKLAVDTIAPKFDFVLIDCPAGIDDGFHRAVVSAEEAIVVTTPHISALRDADKVITLLKSYDYKKVFLVANKLRGDLLAVGESLAPKEIEELLKTPLIGVLPEEYLIYKGALTNAHPAFKMIANNLLTGKKRLYDVTRKYVGLVGGLRRFLKRNL
ncbi:MAG: septum site-determining protein MinD [Clostridiales bacterium]|nr:septum site-determining protein MinD [Clostridiales bacterium]